MNDSDPVAHIRRWSDDFTRIRRDLHAHPELGFEEHRTARLVCDQLADFGIEHHAGVGRTGVVAVVEGRSDTSGKRIGLRPGDVLTHDFSAMLKAESERWAQIVKRSGITGES